MHYPNYYSYCILTVKYALKKAHTTLYAFRLLDWKCIHALVLF